MMDNDEYVDGRLNQLQTAGMCLGIVLYPEWKIRFSPNPFWSDSYRQEPVLVSNE